MKRWVVGLGLLAAACGGGGGDSPPQAPPFLPTLLVYAGDPAIRETRDGIGSAARFSEATRISGDDATRNLYVGERFALRKIAPDATVSTVPGNFGPYTDVAHHEELGLLAAIQPTCLRCQRVSFVRIASSAVFTAMPLVSSSDGTRLDLGEHLALAPDRAGNVLITGDHHAVLRLTPGGDLTTVVANIGPFGPASPASIATDAEGNIYVSDTGNHVIRKITPVGAVSVLAGGTQGAADGVGTAARFSWPQGIVVDAWNNVWVADMGNHAVRRITPEGKVNTVVGQLGKAGFVPGALPASLESPRDVAILEHDLYIVMDWGIAIVRDGAY